MKRAALVLGLVGLALAVPITSGSADEPTTSVSVTLGAEAWYGGSAACVGPICLPITLPNTYPAGTLHVATTLGKESARTYLAIPSDAVATGVTVTGGLLRLPLDTLTVGNGSVTPDVAKLQVCTTTAPITAVAGATTTPPVADCTTSAPSSAIGIPATELDVDLTPLAAHLGGATTGLVLLPAPGGTGTWHVTLSANTRTNPPVPAPTLTLTVSGAAGSPAAAPSSRRPAVTPTTAAAPTAVAVTDAPPVGGGGFVPPPVDLPGATMPTAVDGPAPVVAPTAAAAPSTTPVSAIAALPGSTGFSYSAVFLLPLLLGAGLIWFGRQLTRPLTREAPRA